jgi:hypothetical protein
MSLTSGIIIYILYSTCTFLLFLVVVTTYVGNGMTSATQALFEETCLQKNAASWTARDSAHFW